MSKLPKLPTKPDDRVKQLGISNILAEYNAEIFNYIFVEIIK